MEKRPLRPRLPQRQSRRRPNPWERLHGIGLARIDDRLIHGQVATRWTKETNVTRIIVVSDEVAADTVRKTLLTQVAPPRHRSRGGCGQMIRVYNNPKYAGQRVMLFTNPTDVERIVEAA